MTVTREQLDDAVDAYRDACWKWARTPSLAYFTAANAEAVQAKYDAARQNLNVLLDQVVPR